MQVKCQSWVSRGKPQYIRGDGKGSLWLKQSLGRGWGIVGRAYCLLGAQWQCRAQTLGLSLWDSLRDVDPLPANR